MFLWQAAPAEGAGAAADHFSITQMVKSMGTVAIAVVVILLIMSVYSIAIMVERYLTYSAAKKQSREFAPRVAQALKNDRIEEAINISDKHRKSTWQWVSTFAGVSGPMPSSDSSGVN